MVIRNTLWLSLSFVVGKVLSTIWQLYIARFFTKDPEAYGYYMLLVTQSTVWLALADGSLAYAAQQVLAGAGKDRRSVREHVTAILAFRAVLGTAAGLGFFVLMALKFPGLALPASLLALNLAVFALGTAPLGVWAADEDFRVEASSSAISTPLFIGSAYLCTLFTENITAIVACYLLGTVASAAFVWSRTLRRWPICRMAFSRLGELTRRYLRLAAPLTASTFVFILFYRGDMLFVAEKVGATGAGVFAIALLLFFLAVDLTWSQFGKAYTPRLFSGWRQSGGSESALDSQIRKLLEIYSLMGTAILLATALGGRFVLGLVFGGNSPWVEAIYPLFWLLTGFVPLVGHAILSRLLLIEEKPFRYLAASSAIVGLKLVLLWSFSGKLGLMGVSLLTAGMMLAFYLSLAALLAREGRRLFLDPVLLARILGPSIAVAFLVGWEGGVSASPGKSLSIAAMGIVIAASLNFGGLQAIARKSKMGMRIAQARFRTAWPGAASTATQEGNG